MIVVAALIQSGGKLLACQRRRGGPLELLWEFPGGKVQFGETLESALARELAEELGIAAIIGHEVYRTRHSYAQMTEPLELIFFLAEADVSKVQNRVFERIEWREPQSLPELDFLPADRELIERLAAGELSLKP